MNKAYMKGNKPDMKKRIKIMTYYVEYGYNCSQIAKPDCEPDFVEETNGEAEEEV